MKLTLIVLMRALADQQFITTSSYSYVEYWVKLSSSSEKFIRCGSNKLENVMVSAKSGFKIFA